MKDFFAFKFQELSFDFMIFDIADPPLLWKRSVSFPASAFFCFPQSQVLTLPILLMTCVPQDKILSLYPRLFTFSPSKLRLSKAQFRDFVRI